MMRVMEASKIPDCILCVMMARCASVRRPSVRFPQDFKYVAMKLLINLKALLYIQTGVTVYRCMCVVLEETAITNKH